MVALVPDTLVLSLQYSLRPGEPLLLAVSLSNGDVVIIDTHDYQVKNRFSGAHSLEVWTVAWSGGCLTPALYTGGDDSALCCLPFGNTLGPAVDHPYARTALDFVRDSKTHEAGVTAILPLTIDRDHHEWLLTGSYDEYVRVLQITSRSKKTQVMADLRLNGGVWQLRHLKSEALFENEAKPMRFWVLASCMHAGCRVLEISKAPQRDGSWAIEVVAKFEEHESMNYASDVKPDSYLDDVKKATFVSTSFYDKKLCIWQLKDT
ncbi:MAG: hypothetical protein Q9207_000336 [Kuettlingeria erythrocarpa]